MNLLATLALTLASFVAPPEEPFADLSLADALAAAGKAEKVVMIDWFTTWCGPCKKLDLETWPDERVRAWLGEHAVALKIDAEKDVETAGKYAIRAYPTLLFLKPDGTEIGRIVGFRDPARFLEDAADVLAGRSAVEIAREKLEQAGGNDPMLRDDLGSALADAGRHEEALVELLWCWDHGLEHRPSYSGVRVSFLLGKIERLARAYPPALDALRERRDACAAELLAGGELRYETANDLAHLNETLGESRATLDLYDALLAREGLGERERSAVRLGLFDQVVDLLIEARRYQDVLDGAGDPDGFVERELLIATRMADTEEATMLKGFAVGDCAPIYAALLGVGRLDEARALADRLIAFHPRKSTCDRLRRCAKDVGAAEDEAALRARGKELGEAERAERKAARERAGGGASEKASEDASGE